VDYVFDFLYEGEKNVLIPDVEFSLDTVKAHRRVWEHLKQEEGEQCQWKMAIHLNEIDIYLKKMGEKKVIQVPSERSAAR